jgi:hypothetical protein
MKVKKPVTRKPKTPPAGLSKTMQVLWQQKDELRELLDHTRSLRDEVMQTAPFRKPVDQNEADQLLAVLHAYDAASAAMRSAHSTVCRLLGVDLVQ